MSAFLDSLAFSLSVTGPIFVVLVLGIWFRRIELIGDVFIRDGSRLVFNVALPMLLFLSVARTDIRQAANGSLVVFAIVATIVVYIALEWAAKRWIRPARDRGVVVQGAFRSNLGIVGLAYCANTYGEAGIVAASVHIAILTILFNILGVITLRRSLHGGQGVMPMLRGVVTNPLIIGIVLALPMAPLGIELPQVAAQSAQYFANLTLPLALLCTGASLDFAALKGELRNTAVATVGRLVVVPAVITIAAALLGYRGMDLGILMLLFASPAAAASYIMVRAMGGNAALAANIIATTTFGSVVATSIAITLMRGLGLM
ncbi:MAG: AEC family transporter [Gemmatimonadales bacterium]|nr:AEC family transporter [Gemmatimonadales bacterium]